MPKEIANVKALSRNKPGMSEEPKKWPVCLEKSGQRFKKYEIKAKAISKESNVSIWTAVEIVDDPRKLILGARFRRCQTPR